MLHIIKQIRGGFIGFIVNNFSEIKRSDLQDLASIDWDKDRISKEDLAKSNSKIAKLIENAFEEQNGDMIYFNNERLSSIEDLLKEQGHEIVNMMKKHSVARKTIVSSSKKAVKKETSKSKISVYNIMDADNDDFNVSNNTEKKSTKFQAEISNNNVELKFNWTLKRGSKNTEEIKALQNALWMTNLGKGYWKFWPATEKAVKAFQKANWLKADGKVGSNTLAEINGNKIIKNKENKKEKPEEKLLSSLWAIKKFIKAYNETHWNVSDKLNLTSFISTNHSLLAVPIHLSRSDRKALSNKLNINEDDIASKLWIGKNSEQFKKWMERMILTAIASALVSWWESMLLEIFSINLEAVWRLLGIKDFTVKYKKLKSPNKVVELMTGKKVDIRKLERDTILSSSLTVPKIHALQDLLNDKDMDPATLRRYVEGIFDPNVIQKGIAAIFGSSVDFALPKGYTEILSLIWELEDNPENNDSNLKNELIWKIRKLSKEYKKNLEDASKKSIEKYNEVLKEYKNAKKWYDNDKTDTAKFMLDHYNWIKTNWPTKDLISALWGLTRLKMNTHQYALKEDKLEWKQTFTNKELNWMENKYQNQINELLWKKVKLKNYDNSLGELLSGGSYWPEVKFDSNWKMINVENYINVITTQKAPWENASILAVILRWIEQYDWVDITAKEFLNAMRTWNVYLARKWDLNYIIWNQSRKKDWKIREQGKITWEEFIVKIGSVEHAFKGLCFNKLTTMQEREFTTKTTAAVPVYKKIDLKNKKKEPKPEEPEEEPEEAPDDTTPGEEPIDEPVEDPASTEMWEEEVSPSWTWGSSWWNWTPNGESGWRNWDPVTDPAPVTPDPVTPTPETGGGRN